MMRVEHIKEQSQFQEYLQAVKAKLYPKHKLPYTLSSDGDQEYNIAQLALFDDGQPIACLCLYHNPGVHHNHLKTLQVGNYESTNSGWEAGILFEKVFEFGRQNGFGFIVGPINGSTWYNYRFKLDTNHPNFFLEPYHQHYYIKQFVDNGFKAISNYISAIDHRMDFRSETLQCIEEKLHGKGVVFRLFNMENLEDELKQIHRLSVSAFKNNAYYTPLPWENFWEKNKMMIPKLDPRLFLVAEKSGEIIGYLFATENHFNKEGKQAVLKTLAVKTGREFLGTGFILLNKLNDYLRHIGYSSIVHAYMSEDNNAINMSGKYCHGVYSRYSLFGQKL